MTKYPYAGDGRPYTGPSVAGQLAAAFTLALPVVILMAIFSYSWG
jgi:hypothetical protein